MHLFFSPKIQNAPNVCVSINKVARETNEELRAIQAVPAEGFDVGAILVIARRYDFLSWKIYGL